MSSAEKKNESVAIVVPHWNALELTASCCRDLARQDYPDFKIWVVDNGSSEHSPEALVEACPDARVLRLETNRGYAGGANAGIRAAFEAMDVAYVWLLNNDVSCAPDTLSRLLEEAGRDERTGVVGCDLIEGGKRDAVRRLRAARRLKHPFFVSTELRRDGQADYLCGASLLIRGKVFESIGLFDENFFFFFEDADFCVRATRAGWRLATAPGVTPRHYGSATIGRFSRMQAHCYRAGHVRFLRKHSRWPVAGAWAIFVTRLFLNAVRFRWSAVAGNCSGWREAWSSPPPDGAPEKMPSGLRS